MSSAVHGKESLDSFAQSGGFTIAENPSKRPLKILQRSPTKRAREDSDPESDCVDEDDMDRMDLQEAKNVTATHAIGDDTTHLEDDVPQVPAPLSPEHAALRSDIEIIRLTVMEQLYTRITADIEKSAADTTMALRKANDQLRNQVTSLGARITQLQQQVLMYQAAVQHPHMTPITAPTKKDTRKKKEKMDTSSATAASTTGRDTSSYAAVATAAMAVPTPTPTITNNKGWTTLKVGGKNKKTTTPKLIPTIYPQTEREVTCYFTAENESDTIPTEPDHTIRQAAADVALRRVNSALVNNKDVTAPPFIRSRVTMRGSIVFTTSNTQHNIIYEDYVTIIADALSYYGNCERVEIGKRFSQFLLHGVPTHFSLPEISDSIATNYPQLVQGQTPRWLTPANRREHKANSTIVMTLTGNIKKESIGRQYLIVCNRQCQLDEYISYGRTTQCRNCQQYGHPAALCRESPRCAVCADPHSTKDHPCSLPACKKGPACTHPPIRCANCNSPHKASDPNCPERIKLRTFNPAPIAVNMGDAPMAGVAN